MEENKRLRKALELYEDRCSAETQDAKEKGQAAEKALSMQMDATQRLHAAEEVNQQLGTALTVNEFSSKRRQTTLQMEVHNERESNKTALHQSQRKEER